jgi:hypothetical protein
VDAPDDSTALKVGLIGLLVPVLGHVVASQQVGIAIVGHAFITLFVVIAADTGHPSQTRGRLAGRIQADKADVDDGDGGNVMTNLSK